MATIFGSNASETINFSDGVTNGDDVIYAGAGDDWVFAFGGNDTLHGAQGNDVLVGGAGADLLNGGTGSDTAYYLDSTEGVVVSLTSGQGIGGTADGDTLYWIENLTGSLHDDWLVGDAGGNVLSGSSGDDFLKGAGGADTLNGGPGKDTASYGGSSEGVVVLLISDYAAGGDAAGDELNDIENLTGSAHDDILYGHNGGNVLRGMDGDDVLKGYGGADTLYGGDHNDYLEGMDGTDTLRGEAGNDTLDGGASNDVLTGGIGSDTFVFSTAPHSVVNVDQVTDFSVVDDTIHLDNAVFSALADGALAASAFHVGSAAADAGDRIIYDSATGALLYDADGSGAVAAVQLAQLSAGLALSNNDFFVI